MISVIVPIYNVEKYLPRCIESILAQSYRDFELLLVDDGSTDGSGRICDEYAAKDGRVVAFHKENGGVSDARNYGLDRVRGDYVCFVDSDDYVGRDYLGLMYEMLTEKNADMAIVSYTYVFEEEPAFIASEDRRSIYDRKEAFHQMLLGSKYGWGPIAKLMRRKIADDMTFPVGYIYDDFYTIPYVFEKCEACVYSTSIQYYYYQRAQSLTHGMSADRFEMWEMGIDKLAKYVNDKYPEYNKEAETLFLNSYFRYIDHMLDSKDYLETAQRSKKKYAQYLRKIWVRPLGWKRRISATLSCLSPRLYRGMKKAWLLVKRDPFDRKNRKLMETR